MPSVKAAVWTADRRLATEDRPEPILQAGEVLVRVRACGICGSDLHQYHGATPVRPGLVPGHEIAGTVVAGEGFAAGTAVAVEPLLTCGTCAACVAGAAPICRSRVLLGVARDGGMQEYVSVPRERAFALPAGVDTAVGSLAEPLAVSLRGVGLAAIPPGGRVLILGAGTIGLLTAVLARAVASEVAITARYDHQAAAARALGAGPVFAADGVAARSWAAASAPDAVIETVGGTGETLSEALDAVRPGGTVVALGVFSERPQIPATRLVVEEISLRGSLMYGHREGRSEFGSAVALLASIRAEVAALQTHRFGLVDCQRAFEAAADKRSRALKVTVME